MKILYGVVGEGMGHAMRSRVVLEHLLRQDHEIEIMASSRAADFLAKRFEGVTKIHGFHMIYDENRVRRGATLWSNVLQGVTGIPKNIARYFEGIGQLNPDVVISDFESWTYLYAKAHRKPIISIDNMQIINRCTHAPDIVEGEEADYQVSKAFIKGKLPFCDHYCVTTFFYPDLRKEKTSLHPPILRPEILAAPRTRGDHLLVYQTAEGNEGLADVLQRSGMECRVYGMRRNLTSEQVDGNLRYQPFSEDGFIRDLASSRAVVAGGGFTLMGEAVYLRKPMLAVPLEHQFEQVMNSRYLKRLGYGDWTPKLDSPDILQRFIRSIPACEEALSRYDQDGNNDLFQALDHLLDRAAAGIL